MLSSPFMGRWREAPEGLPWTWVRVKALLPLSRKAGEGRGEGVIPLSRGAGEGRGEGRVVLPIHGEVARSAAGAAGAMGRVRALLPLSRGAGEGRGEGRRNSAPKRY